MANRHQGATLRKTIYVDRDDIRHLARISGSARPEHVNWQAATNAGYERLVAPSTLIVSYFEAALAALFDVSTAGRLTDLVMGFANPVYAGERIVVDVEVNVWIEDEQRACVTLRVQKENGSQSVAVGTAWIDLSR